MGFEILYPKNPPEKESVEVSNLAIIRRDSFECSTCRNKTFLPLMIALSNF